MMNNKTENLKEIISNLEIFMCPDFPDLNVYSKQYFENILLPIYDNQEVCCTYIDFNKLSVINENEGKDAGDKALFESLKIVKHCIPSDSSIIRLGGDEFLVVTPTLKKDTANNLFEKINSLLIYKSTSLYGLTFTWDSENSAKNTINKTIFSAENKVSMKKHRNKNARMIRELNPHSFIDLPIPENISEEEKLVWDKINLEICKSVQNHLRDIRPSKEFRYQNEDFKQSSIALIGELGNLIESNNKEKKIASKIISKNSISYDDAYLIHSLFTHKISPKDINQNYENLSSLDASMKELFNLLIREPHSELFSKAYYNLYLSKKLCNSNKSYQTIYFSACGIRPSNTAYGHDFTDERIEKTSKIIIDAFLKKRQFSNLPFEFDSNSIFLTDQGGGNYLALLPEEMKLSTEEIESIISDINSVANNMDMNSSFYVATSSMDNISNETIPNIVSNNNYKKNNFIRFARHLKDICNEEKDVIKRANLTSTDNMVAFRKSILNCVSYYLKNVPNPQDISKKRFFLTNIFTSLLNHESLYNVEMDNKKAENENLNFPCDDER